MNRIKEILVVDDEPQYRSMISKKLKDAGYHAVLAQNGEEALVALWENHGISLVLLDVRLPYINGYNISEIIRKDFPNRKVIICSALQKEEQKFLIDDADEYFYKSEDLSVLVEKINKVLNCNDLQCRIVENEKRMSKRISVNVLASCESINNHEHESSIHCFSYTKDLSLYGGRFIFAEDLHTGQHLSVALELPSNFLPVLIDCEVVWVRKLDDHDPKNKGSIEVGVKFVKLDMHQDEDKLKNYLNFV